MSKLWTKIERKRRKYITIYYRKFKKEIFDLVKPVLAMLEYSIDLDSLIGTIPSLINTDRINETLIELYGVVGRDFATSVSNMILKKDKDVFNIKSMEEDLWQEWMEQWAIREAGIKVLSINKYSKEQFIKVIREEIRTGTEQGLGTNQIAANMRKRLPKEWRRGSTWKARRIAQTEVIGASNRASFESARQSGVSMMKTWLTAPLGLAKNERHTLPGVIEELTVPMNQKFRVDGGNGYEEMDCPGDGSASNVINCRCTLTYEVI